MVAIEINYVNLAVGTRVHPLARFGTQSPIAAVVRIALPLSIMQRMQTLQKYIVVFPLASGRDNGRHWCRLRLSLNGREGRRRHQSSDPEGSQRRRFCSAYRLLGSRRERIRMNRVPSRGVFRINGGRRRQIAPSHPVIRLLLDWRKRRGTSRARAPGMMRVSMAAMFRLHVACRVTLRVRSRRRQSVPVWLSRREIRSRGRGVLRSRMLSKRQMAATAGWGSSIITRRWQ